MQLSHRRNRRYFHGIFKGDVTMAGNLNVQGTTTQSTQQPLQEIRVSFLERKVQ